MLYRRQEPLSQRDSQCPSLHQGQGPAPYKKHAHHCIRSLVLFFFCCVLFACAPKQQPADMVTTEVPPQTTPTVLLAGDSIMEALGPVLAKSLAHRQDLGFVQAGRSSTGLCRPDYYDWPSTMRTLMTSLRPQTVVICIGTNDDQSVTHTGKRYAFNTPGWEQAYAAKVQEMIDIIAERGGTSLWVSPPIMGPKAMRARVAFIKDVIARTCAKNNVVFVDVWNTLADSAGLYQRYGRDAQGKKIPLRTKDGVHVTRAGNALLARHILPYMEKSLTLQR